VQPRPAISIHAVVPVKPLALAKSRLAGVLAPAERRDLVLEMLSRVLRSLAAAPRAITATWVTSADHDVLDLAEELGARPLPDAGANLNGALDLARARLSAGGAGAMLVLPADVPLVSAGDLAALAAALRGPAAVALAPDSAGSGSNALGLRLPSDLPFHFGPNSAARHRAAAAARGLAVYEHISATLGLDVDDPASLERYRDCAALSLC
jgi:2-phospho-L-lactate guanylyltransferase